MAAPLTISGISCRLPESDNMTEFKENLFSHTDMITDDGRRWTPGIYGLPTRCGKLKDISQFDAQFFNVHAKQAHLLDPQLRLLLELTYEAIVDSGTNPSSIRGKKCGVFIGASASESDEAWSSDPDSINGYGLTGCCRAMFANRISYTFDFKGPSFAIDTACSSSLLAMEQAVSAIRAGHCDSAIVGGVNLLLKPQSSLQFHRLGMLAKDGKCKAFDIEGNGYVRSEAAAVIFIQKKDVALRHYADILHAKTNTDGYKEQGITFPAGAVQKQLLQEIYSEAGVDPSTVTYVEAHGTGTKVGDPQELNAIADVFCNPDGKRKNPLLIGSVKSNMGHSEPASGLCSIAKVLIAMQEGIIPANLHFNKPNPDILALNDGRFKVVAENTPWNGGIVGINSFGFGGANVHVILEAGKKIEVDVKIETPILVPYSGRTKEAVEHGLKSSAAHDSTHLNALLHNIAKVDIPGHHARGYSIKHKDGKLDVDVNDSITKGPLWYIFSGMGSQWAGMGKDLMELPVFKKSIEKSAAILKPHGIDLVKLLTVDPDTTFNHVLNSFVSIAAVQVALVDTLKSMNLTPDGIIGHSVGELGCAYADGCFTAEETVLAAYARGDAITKANLAEGAMAAVGLSWEDAKKRCPEGVYPACHNAADSVSISGPPAAIDKFVEELKAEGIFAKKVQSSGQAFHSKYISQAGPMLKERLIKLLGEKKERSKRWISTSIEESKWGDEIAKWSSVDYHVNNLLSPVLFHSALSHIPKGATVIEIAPHALLQAVLKRSLPGTTNIGLMNRNAPNQTVALLASIGKIYNSGHNPTVGNLYPQIAYPVSVTTPSLSPLIQWDHSTPWDVAKFGQTTGQNIIQVDLTNELDSFIEGHCIDGRILYPATGYLVLVWKTIAKLHGTTYDKVKVIFENVDLERATILQKGGNCKFTINVLEGSGEFEVIEGGGVAVKGTVRVVENEEDMGFLKLKDLEGSQYRPLGESDVYKELRLRGYDYAGIFRGIKEVDNEGTWAKLAWESNWVSYLDTMLQFSILSQPNRGLYLPTRLQRVAIDPLALTEFVLNNKDSEKGLPAYKYKDLNVVKSRGVELRGLKASLAPRRQGIQADPKLEEYTFVPYFDESGLSNIRTLVDIVIENTQTLKLKVTEITRSVESAIADQVHTVANGQPMYQDDITVLTTKSEQSKVPESWTKGGFKVVAKDEIAPPAEAVHLIVLEATDNIDDFEQSTVENGFILVKGKTNKTSTKFNLVASNPSGSLYKKIPTSTNHVVFKITNDEYSWLTPLKNAMTAASTDPTAPKIYLTSTDELTGLQGFVNCLKQEPGGHVIRSILGGPHDDKIFAAIQKADLISNIVKGGKVGTYRHRPLAEQSETTVQHAYINTLTRGDLSSLRWIESDLKYTPNTPNSELCTVEYAPLNFRDIMLATGKLPPDALPGNLAMQDCVLGLEFAGRNKQNKRVMGLVDAKGLATHVMADPTFMWEVPDKWTMEEAATVPVCYATAYYALVVRGQLKPKETVLIHSGSGGVGQAAISIALSMNCTVFTTVGSTDKKELLKKAFPALQEWNFANSRDTSFEQHVLTHTKGRGVDLVLNSLAEEKLQASVRLLAVHGRFLEIGKFDLSKNSALGMSIFLKNVTFHGILLDSLFEHPESKKTVVELVSQGIKSGAVKPLPFTVYSSNEIEEAFRFMASGKHVGKVVIKVNNQKLAAARKTYFSPAKSYVIIGGLGGFGLELAGWMTERGAKNIVLASRSGVTTGYQDLCIRRWRENGVNVQTPKVDVTTEKGVTEFLTDVEKMAPIGGIFNLAMVLKDGFIENQTEENFKAVITPKVNSTRYTDLISRKLCKALDYFVVFSSVSCGRGNAGQSNYGLANSAMERICEKRQEQGFPGMAIQWGAIGDVGVVADHMGGNDTNVGGTLPQRMPSCLNALDKFLGQGKPVVASMVLAERGGQGRKEGGAGLVESVARILGMKDVSNVNTSSSLAELGMDSLMGVEVKQALERDYDVVLSMQEIRQLNLAKLKEIDEGTGDGSADSAVSATGTKSDDQIKIYTEELMPKESVKKLNGATGDKLFIVHPIEGVTKSLEILASKLKFAVYGLQCVKEAELGSVEGLAAFYLTALKKVQPAGPYNIAGYSYGCTIALEMALQLEKEGKTVQLIFLDGSHKYVSVQTEEYKSKAGGPVDHVENESNALCTFLTQFSSGFEFGKVKKDLSTLPDLTARVKYTADLLAPAIKVEAGEIEAAALSFYLKLVAVDKYQPKTKFNGKAVLVKALKNRSAQILGEDYSLKQVCAAVVIHGVDGTHRSLVEEPAVEQVGKILNQL